jgi:hypothetical protein
MEFGDRGGSMINKSTVFVLGAGASWHYGYPTGEELVDEVIVMAGRFYEYCQLRLSNQPVVGVPDYVSKRTDASLGAKGALLGWKQVSEECQLLSQRLKAVRPILIDHFLAWNDSLRPIGKLMIAAVILKCESAKAIRRGWYRFVVHKLVHGCKKSADLFDNDVHFVTFNYDASLEYYLFQGLTSLDILTQADVEKFLTKDRIAHTYGCIHKTIPMDTDFVNHALTENFGRPMAAGATTEFVLRKNFLDQCLVASNNLRTIDPHDKEEDEDILATARRWIEHAKVVYILGYGFDEQNSKRLGLYALPKGNNKAVMFTNFNNTNTINKRAGRLFFEDFSPFLTSSAAGHPARGYFEKSEHDVYGAFENDFEALEIEPPARTAV